MSKRQNFSRETQYTALPIKLPTATKGYWVLVNDPYYFGIYFVTQVNTNNSIEPEFWVTSPDFDLPEEGGEDGFWVECKFCKILVS